MPTLHWKLCEATQIIDSLTLGALFIFKYKICLTGDVTKKDISERLFRLKAFIDSF